MPKLKLELDLDIEEMDLLELMAEDLDLPMSKLVSGLLIMTLGALLEFDEDEED